MTFEEFNNLLKEKNIDIAEVANAIGYTVKSIRNNWNKPGPIPKNAEKTVELFFRVKELEKLVNSNNNICLDEVAQKIAIEKCKNNGLAIEDYLSSLVKASV